MQALGEVLAGNRYPGRGVVWARTGDGRCCGAYVLTGRTRASQARELRRAEGELVVAATEGPGGDPLRHYVGARERGEWLVYGNGEQVAEVGARLDLGAGPGSALSGLSYEPDPPIFTPRITAVVHHPTGRAWFGAARRSARGREEADVLTLAVGALAPGDAVLMTTYRSDGRTVAGAEPYVETVTRAAAPGGPDGLVAEIWDALDPGLRVAVAVFEPGALGGALLRHR
ncbi:IMP cyclohydrolase [Actinacidiphila yanglinensis]|uniref:IMP cyclohydrolase n=1 Tax=Actinacidiphila yanglinensis TaxID=310779 RepID=A0A1H5YLI1_9ACTN|nr:IMP cyclohydrolase [Actinacidiphila yanglinensis]SEG25001.1 IMP cyclohydrolase [Actinacidiphila yanglinensis]